MVISVSDGIERLVADESGKFLNAVALRVAPPRSSTSKPKPEKAKPAPAPVPEDDTRSPMQKLMDRFK